MKQVVSVLDKGELALVDFMGTDKSVVDSARVSYQGGTKTVREDIGLIDYLWRNKHTTPFEQVELQFCVKAPIFVVRQWHRHRTWSYNEESARYSVMKGEFYIPDPARLGKQSKTNKQGTDITGIDSYTDEDREFILGAMQLVARDSYHIYKDLIEKYDLSREVARMILPLNLYTSMYAKANLANVLRFITLRDDSHAQYEVRCYANAMRKMLEEYFPMVMEVYNKHTPAQNFEVFCSDEKFLDYYDYETGSVSISGGE